MICPKCGIEYSDKVYEIHKHICKGKSVVKKKTTAKKGVKRENNNPVKD